jgi:hypothetical protein
VLIRPLIVGGIWVLAAAALAAAAWQGPGWAVTALARGAKAALGTWDLVQTRHTILRVYPIIGTSGSSWN